MNRAHGLGCYFVQIVGLVCLFSFLVGVGQRIYFRKLKAGTVDKALGLLHDTKGYILYQWDQSSEEVGLEVCVLILRRRRRKKLNSSHNWCGLTKALT